MLLFNAEGEAIKKIRDGNGETLIQVAARGGLNARTLGNWEKGQSARPGNLPGILKGLDVSEFKLFETTLDIQMEHYVNKALHKGCSPPLHRSFLTEYWFRWMMGLDFEDVPEHTRGAVEQLRQAQLVRIVELNKAFIDFVKYYRERKSP